MKIKHFIYKKPNEDESSRRILILANTKGYVDGIDLDKLSKKEEKELKEYMEKHEKFMKPFIGKGFRRFSKDKMK